MRFILKFLTICSFLAIMSAQASERDWEQWDNGDVSETIDAYWLASSEEIEHRKTLAALTKKWALPSDNLLEIGCGSGLVYNVLVPEIISNKGYVGIDISEKMLQIASRRFPMGVFVKDDLYALSFADNSFDVVAAFEVFGHISDINKPIKEMFRTTSRYMIFTVWTGPKTVVEKELFENAVFIHTTFSHEDILAAINLALKTESYKVHTELLPGNKAAYIIHKDQKRVK